VRPGKEDGRLMLWTIFVILLILWLLGLVSGYTLSGFIHILLVIAVVILIINLISGFNANIADNPAVPPSAKETIAANTEAGIDIVPVAQVEERALKAGLTEAQATAVADDYGDAQLDALRISLGAVAAAALISLWFTRGLPRSSVAPAASQESVRAAASS